MNENTEIQKLLAEIRDNQRVALQRQEEHLEIARKQFDRSNNQIEESIGLQRLAVDRVKKISRIAIPGIVVCMLLIVYLMVRYF